MEKECKPEENKNERIKLNIGVEVVWTADLPHSHLIADDLPGNILTRDFACLCDPDSGPDS